MPLPTPSSVVSFVFATLPALALLNAAPAHGQPAATNTLTTRAEMAFVQAQKMAVLHPGDARADCELGRATYNYAELTTNSEQRASIAKAGIAGCRQLLARDPHSGAGHYYLGMDYGELAAAEAPSMAAYKLVREIEREFKEANELDEKYDFGGPPRCLGLLYRDAPGWPVSIGNRHKAREYLNRAAEIAPDFPENQMNLLESAIMWHQPTDAEKAWKKLNAIWPAARKDLAGPYWEQDWEDWNKRRAKAAADFEKTFKRRLEPANP